VEAVTDDLPIETPEQTSTSKKGDGDWLRCFTDIAAGRLGALDELYDAAASRLYGLALWRTGSVEDAADVVQDVFVRVVEQGPRLKRIRNPKAWLLTVTNRAAIDVTRRRRRQQAEPFDECVFLAVADEDDERMFAATQVSAILAGLPDAQRVVIYLKHFVGCTFSEIGDVVGAPKFTAASRYRNGIENLRKLLEGDHEAR
jgi:RNA polymerase sigma-70 factor (ECF subfamily)